jgi:predicted AAA+ superfamily ATPase
MIKQSELAAVVQSQQEQQQEKGVGLERDLLHHLPTDLPNHALIISGIRRCGKSTLLSQWMKKIDFEGFFLNFDTPKLYNFELTDFELLDEIIVQSKKKSLFFDEIQVIDGWELYVRQKLDQGYKVAITGSNASLLSKELGTKLTGRHINRELFPFSFSEFLRYHEAIPDAESLLRYMTIGGFPEYIKTENPDILAVLIDDILYRDIAVRYNIRDVKSLKRLLLFLAANNGNLVTATKLTQTLGIKSPATILDYFSFFEQSYLLQLMPKFSYSYRVQLVNPRKVYFVDTGLINVVDVSFSHDLGRKLENVIFWELRRQNKEIYYYNENGYECDFVVCNNKIPEQLIQVCYELNKDNSTREERGLLDAMNFFKLNKGTIITLNQQDTILHHEKRIEVVPAHRYLSQ